MTVCSVGRLAILYARNIIPITININLVELPEAMKEKKKGKGSPNLVYSPRDVGPSFSPFLFSSSAIMLKAAERERKLPFYKGKEGPRNDDDNDDDE